METVPDLHVPSPVGRRILAFIFDSAIASVPLYPLLFIVFLIVGIPNPENLAREAQSLELRQLILLLVGILFVILIFALIWHAYFIYFEHIYGRTPGKKALGLRVVSANSRPLTFKQCLLRELTRCYLDMLFFFPALISMYVTKKKQRIGDLVTDTFVVYMPEASLSEVFLYLSKQQFDLRKQRYKVADAPLEEVLKFLEQSYGFLLGQSNPSISEDFVNKYLIPIESTIEDTYEMKHRFLAEYFLQLRRTQ